VETTAEYCGVDEAGLAAYGLLTTKNTDGWAFDQVARVFVETECTSVETRRAYLRQLLQGAKMLGVKSVTDVRLQHLLVLRKLVMDSPASPSTKALFVAAWRSFLKWRCVRPVHGIAMDDVKDLLKAPRASVIAPYDILSKAEIAKMMDTAGTLRDRAILLVMLGGGLRASEVVGLDGKDIRLDSEGEYFLLVHGKGRKDRQVPVHQEVVDAIQVYLSGGGRSLRDDGALFLAHDWALGKRQPGRLSTRGLGLLIATLTAACGILAKKVSPHALRHTYATAALRQGGNLIAVSKLLGHAQVSTTQRYLDHLELGELRKVVPKVLP
jgi:integrase/recombinase XerC